MYEFYHAGKSFRPNESGIVAVQSEVDERNAEMSRQELADFNANPPLRYFAYISEKRKTLDTWMGDKLGDVQFGAAYRIPAFGGFSSTRVNIRVRATNGEWYSGTYYKSSGNYARIRWTARKGW